MPNHRIALDLDRQFGWGNRIVGYAAIAAVWAAGVLTAWWLLAAVGVALLVPRILEPLLLARYPEATDPVARREALSVPDAAVSWVPVVIALSLAVLVLSVAWMRSGWSLPDVGQVWLLWVVVLLMAAGILRRRSALRERAMYGQTVIPENKPIDPR